MIDQEKYESIPVTRNSLSNSSSEHHLARDNSLSSRFGESLPAMNANNEQITQIGSNLTRFPDDFSNLNDSSLDNTSPITISIRNTEQSNVENDQHPSPNTNNEPETLEETKTLSRQNDVGNEHEKEENTEIPPKEEKTNETIDSTPTHPTTPPSTNITRTYVREFLPTSADDPVLSILRNLFVRSLEEFYKEIETQLDLKSQRSLTQWLNETFDEEQQAILSKKYRCFLLCGNENQDSNEIILAFLTLKEEVEEEKDAVYIAQVVVRLDLKRRGYGAQLLQHLRHVYPPNTQYRGTCQRVNRPAFQFCLKQGASFMKNDEIAKKYELDPSRYVGFEFIDTLPVIDSSTSSLDRMRPNTDHSEEESTAITDATTNNGNPPTRDNNQQALESLKKNKKKVVGCCNIS